MMIHPPDNEILATITGLDAQSAGRILHECGGAYALARTPLSTIEQLPGVGKQRARRILAATQWAVLLQKPDTRAAHYIKTPTDAANLVTLEMSLLDHEELRVVCLNTKNRVLAINTIYSGSLNTTVIRIAEVFKPAIEQNANSIILLHNHPSGDPTPSPEDVTVTGMIIDAGKLLNIEVLDHIVISGGKFISMKERGLAFK